MQTEYILNLEDGLINKVDFWTKHLIPVVKINDLETRGVQDFIYWFKEFPLVIENPEDYIPVYKKLRAEKLTYVCKIVRKSNHKFSHPASIFHGEYISLIDETWGGAYSKKKRGMLVAGGIGDPYTSCYMSGNSISLNDGDDHFLHFYGDENKLEEMWKKLKLGAPYNYVEDFKKMGFFYD
jgi:hypothetical protein